MSLSAFLILTPVLAMLRNPDGCLHSKNLTRVYSRGGCYEESGYTEFNVSSDAISVFGQSLSFDIPCDTIAVLFVPEGSGRTQIGDFPSENSCVTVGGEPKDFIIEFQANKESSWTKKRSWRSSLARLYADVMSRLGIAT